MRLLKNDGQGNLGLVEKHDSDIPRYAILSHTWGADNDEFTFKDVTEGTGADKIGYKKIDFCRAQATRDDLQHFWVDTCCIDKSSSAELSEAINSMFHWYQNADKCYVYLSDVSKLEGTKALSSPSVWEAAFRGSRWFKRGWTLQELLAPASVDFFSHEGHWLGSKTSLEEMIHQITGIAVNALRGSSLGEITVEERLAWARHRQTTRLEDQAYSLLGIFNINMPALYGEGRDKAVQRLRREINISLGAPIEQPSNAPLPSSTVPFRRDVDFVDRGASQDRTLLGQIERQCSAPAARVALVGIGGVGKSQLAIEYCHRLREQSPDRWVFWIHASNMDRIKQGYHEIAERIKIPNREDPKANILELVSRWLQDDSKGRWLLVLDNLDDSAILLPPEAAPFGSSSSTKECQLRRPLSAYLPQSQNGTILITTRTMSVAGQLVERRDIIPVDPMTSIDAGILLQRKLDKPTNEQDLQELAKILEYMPLAIVQAAAYIQQKGARYSVRRYIETFQKNEKRQTSLLKYEAGQLRRDADAQNSILITWQISFDEIRARWPASADLLSLMSYFDRQGIPEDVLKVGVQGGGTGPGSAQQEDDDVVKDEREGEGQDMKDVSASKADDDDDLFDEAVERLRSYSFLSIGEHGRIFEMHGLVQLATRKWLEKNGQDEKWKSQFSQKLNMAFPDGEYHNWTVCEILLPHAKSAEKQRPKDDRSVRDWAQILRKAGWYATARGDYAEAERMCELSAIALRDLLGDDDSETSYSLRQLAIVYWSQGRWTEAEKMQVQVMETRQRVLGPEHPDTLSSMANLASTYRNQGRWTEAEKMEVQVMEMSRRVLGDEHPDTLTSMHNLASTYWNQGRWTEAEKIDIQVMETRKRVLGDEHPSTLSSMHNLASTYQNQGRWTEAEKMQVQVMETRKRVLGDEHPSTLTSMDNLASTYWNQGRWTEAEKMQVQVTEMSRRVLGDEHPDTLTSMHNLASTYRNQGRWTEAEKMQVQVMETRKRVLGDEHPLTLTSMNNLAFIMKGQERTKDAIQIMTECVQFRNRILGPEHPNTISSAAALADWSNEDQ